MRIFSVRNLNFSRRAGDAFPGGADALVRRSDDADEGVRAPRGEGNRFTGLQFRWGLLALAAPALLAAPPTPAQEQAWRDGIRQALFIPTPPTLAPEKHGEFEPEPGVIVERVTYGTQFGLRVPAIIYRPKQSTGRGPAFIVVNGHGGDKFSWYANYSGILYARAGAVVLTYDRPVRASATSTVDPAPGRMTRWSRRTNSAAAWAGSW